MYKLISENEIRSELIAIECKCGIQMKIDKVVIDKEEAFICPNCRNMGFADAM